MRRRSSQQLGGDAVRVLSQEEERYFRTLQNLDPSDDMRRIVENAKDDLRSRNQGPSDDEV